MILLSHIKFFLHIFLTLDGFFSDLADFQLKLNYWQTKIKSFVKPLSSSNLSVLFPSKSYQGEFDVWLFFSPPSLLMSSGRG